MALGWISDHDGWMGGLNVDEPELAVDAWTVCGPAGVLFRNIRHE
jgi:hypothetical protein